MDLPLPPGTPPAQPGPLARFLPPLEVGVVRAGLSRWGAPGDLVLDPFGAAPRLAIEAALAGRAVVAASNNPITRFILKRTIQPFSLADLQQALARLGSAPKDGTRIEPFLLELYRTSCASCGESIVAEAFVWDREAKAPAAKIYACPHCRHAGEDPVDSADVERSREYAAHGLQHALALERVAPKGDPDRPQAEAALAMYTGRAKFALITLINKVEQLALGSPLDDAVRALLLSTFDEANALWGHPEGRPRPRQLTASARYLETNVWRALERAVGAWALDDPGVPLTEAKGGNLPEPGSVAVYPGPVRDLLAALDASAFDAVMTVPPRPNQAYWTLSALWAAWLWGKEAAAPIKAALRRRRYEWSWHAGALAASLGGLATSLGQGKPALAFIPEAEPGFFAAAVAGFERAGFQLEGRALRPDTVEAVLLWRAEQDQQVKATDGQLAAWAAEAAEESLRSRGEATPYSILHAAAWSQIAVNGALRPLWDATQGHVISKVGDILDDVLAERERLARLDSFSEAESGVYWLTNAEGAELPLSDRCEVFMLDILRREGEVQEINADRRACEQFMGLLTPERRLIRAILRSYAEQDPESGAWRLREEDQGEARAEDILGIRDDLARLGRRLQYATAADGDVCWLDETGEAQYAFRVSETAILTGALEAPASFPLTYVLPGGRASLVAAKASRDPRLKRWLGTGIRIIKFRHVRRLLTEPGLSRENLIERLSIDPPEHLDPQLPLL